MNKSTQTLDVFSDTNSSHLDIYRMLVEQSPNSFFFLNKSGIIHTPNEGFLNILGCTKKEIASRSIEGFLNISQIPVFKSLLNRAFEGKIQHFYTELINKNNNTVQIELTLIPVNVNGHIIGVGGITKDITAEKEIEHELMESELKFRSIVEEAFVGVYIIQDGKFIYGNPRLFSLLGTKNPFERYREFVHPDDLQNLRQIVNRLAEGKPGIDHTFRVINTKGDIIEVEAHTKKIFYQDQPTILGTVQDITEQKQIQELNKYLAYNDTLTNLPNRRLFQENLEKELIVSKTLEQKIAIMYLDLNRFKYINDTLGHVVGDQLLRQIADRLRICLGDKNELFRMGGDEFAVIMPNIKNTHQAVHLSKAIIEALEDPFFIGGYKLFITTSIGISIFPADGEEAQVLMKNADSALYKSKETGKNAYHIYTSSLNIQTYKAFSIELGLRNAIELNQFEFYYQPKIDSRTSQIVGVEALIRWNHPEWGLLSPDDFIPLAEQTGLISEIGKWVKYKACSQNKEWIDAGLPAIPISINISANRFLEKDLAENIMYAIDETGLAPDLLEIEITETSLLETEQQVMSTINQLREKGVRISLDDFGTGYSSLSYLKRFKGKIDTLKIDRSFISDLDAADSEDTKYIAKGIIDLAHHLKMEVVAEGVETTKQLQILKEYHCETIQGFLYSKPVPADEFRSLLQKGKIEVAEIQHISSEFENKREYFRINLDFPLAASMTLIRIYGRKVELGKTDVLIEDIGLGGLRFLSNIRLTVHRDIILEFETEILGETITLYGSVVWMKEARPGIFQYGLEFLLEESERPHLAKLLNKFAILLRKNPLVPDCSFVKIDYMDFFRQGE